MQTRSIVRRGLRPAAVSLLPSLGLLAALLVGGAAPAPRVGQSGFGKIKSSCRRP